VAAHIGSTDNECLIGAVEKTEIVELKDQDHNPIDACDNCIETEWGMAAIILAPDGVARVVVRAIVRMIEAVLQFSISLLVKW
jgi:hypothetical protein